MHSFSLTGNIVDVLNRQIFPATVTVTDGVITAITPEAKPCETYILPGFIDAHVHIESGMLVPSEFARLAVVHGTVATVSDPHEIANVLGVRGVEYMLDNAAKVPFKFNFGAPSCVPATRFETAGAEITASDIKQLFIRPEVRYLSEMMNFPGVLFDDPEVMEKIRIAKECGRPIDGHAPGLRGKDAERYANAGITTDHECFTLDEATEKIGYGMKILIREGSAAKNYDALHPLLGTNADVCMFCSDDKHPDALVQGHINELVVRSVAMGYDVFDVLRVACVNPVLHYNLDVGLLRVGDPADFIVTEDLQNFRVLQTFIGGALVAAGGKTLVERVEVDTINNFTATEKSVEDFLLPADNGAMIRVIEALDGQLITGELICTAKVEDDNAVSDTERDILKICVVNRYADAPVAVGFIKNFGLKRGAIASCVAHDSHNIIAVGTSDDELCRAVNAIIRAKGGIAVIDGEQADVLPLDVAGIMSPNDGYRVAEDYARLDAAAKALGSSLSAPFMSLSFMALLVIPALKLSDKGLFDGQNFRFANVWM
ncbi:MAG: adenine deaminase [Ignavibacteria bacterium]|nr:adenine deaminase [Ignavibacteria bacterium]